MVTATNAMLKGQRFEDKELVADRGRYHHRVHLRPHPPRWAHDDGGFWPYRLANGRIVINDMLNDPDLMQVLGPLLTPPETPPRKTHRRPVALQGC